MSMAAQAQVTPHISPSRAQKVARVEALKKELLSRPVVALVGIRGVPAANLQGMRRELSLRGHPLHVAPNSLIVHALEAAASERPSLARLVPLVQDQTAILVADTNPFVLSQELDKTRSPVAPRGGEIAPIDVVVPAGETPFKPGPIVGELQHAGFPAAIEKGKVVIKKETLIVRKGSIISREVGPLLARLDIKPLEVGLLLRAAVEEDVFYPREALMVDLERIRGDLVRARQQALGLALHIAFPTAESIPHLLARAQRQGMGLALAAGFVSQETIRPLLEKAARQAKALQALEGLPTN